MNKRIFAVSRYWYNDHQIESSITRIFTDEKKALKFIKTASVKVHADRNVVQWWLIENHPLDLGLKDSYSTQDLAVSVIYDDDGNEQNTRPTPHGKYQPVDHRDVCKECMNEEVLKPVLEYLEIDTRDEEVDIWDDPLDNLTITGRRAPNGHEVSADVITKCLYVKKENGEYIVREEPGGEIEGRYTPG